jgi:hypothetical protein
MEHDLSVRIDLVDRLRAQIREHEKEKKDVLNRYNEQVRVFFLVFCFLYSIFCMYVCKLFSFADEDVRCRTFGIL